MATFQQILLQISLLALTFRSIKSIEELDLSGSNWNAVNQNQSIRVNSTVPGSIYSDLERARVIENIYADFDDVNYRWISYDNWTFEKQFDVDAKLLQKEKLFLTCHGLDTIGQVFLNGHLLGSVADMFIRYRWPVKELLKPQNNLIQVQFISAPIFAKEYFMHTLKSKYTIPPACVPPEQKGECHVNFLRKMASSFSWDWGPAFPTQGIWRPMVIEAFDNFVLRSISVNTQQDSTGRWQLNTTIWLDGAAMSHSSGNLSLILHDTLLTTVEFDVHFDHDGEASVNNFVQIPTNLNIQPWFPNGVGRQYLYELTGHITTANHEATNKTVKIGFRTIKLVQERLPSKAEAYSFYFEVNNVPIYAKGSNWIPAHVLHEAYDEEYIRDLMISAKLANMNMLRIWGGGIYEDDRLYELADEYGILIWQDMMFACALYPTDSQFLSLVATEIKQQVRRLQHHPSIAIWAGNNENEVALVSPWWPEVVINMEKYKNDYRMLYIHTIMAIVEEEDKTRTYVASSPSNGVVSARENYISSNPMNLNYGDVHYYNVFGDVWDWRDKPSAKFVSEYGFQSWSSLDLLRLYISKQYLKYPLTKGLNHREHQPQGLNYLEIMITRYLPLPSNTSTTALNDYIFVSQVFQSMAIKLETEFYRRNRQVQENGEGFTMGALYWQLNDIWPTVSWASLEFGGKWKMLHYYVRNMFDNLLVELYEQDDAVHAVIIRDDHIQQNISFQVTINVYHWSLMKPALSRQLQSLTKPFSVTWAYVENTNQLLQAAGCASRNDCFVQIHIACDFLGEPLQRNNFLLLAPIKNAVGLNKANIEVVDISGPTKDSFGVNTFVLQLQTDNVAAFVWLDFRSEFGINGIFSDNGFMMTNETSINLQTRSNITSDTLNSSLIIKSLNDVQ